MKFLKKYIAEYKVDFAALNLRPHDMNPKVTEHMEAIRSVIAKLIENKNAYVTHGDVNYSVSSFEGYGKLSGRKLEDMQAGSRIEVDSRKQSAEDFALWKSAKEGRSLGLLRGDRGVRAGISNARR